MKLNVPVNSSKLSLTDRPMAGLEGRGTVSALSQFIRLLSVTATADQVTGKPDGKDTSTVSLCHYDAMGNVNPGDLGKG